MGLLVTRGQETKNVPVITRWGVPKYLDDDGGVGTGAAALDD